MGAGRALLIVAETRGRRLTAFDVEADGSLANAQYDVVAKLGRTFLRIQDQARDALRDQGHDWAAGRSIKHLRSTYASRLSEHVSPFQLKDLLGHSSVKTSERHYVAASGDLGRKIQAAFGTAKAEAS